MVNHKTWYAHCFRTQGSDFGFPYHLSGRQVEHAKKTARDLFFNNKWPKQVRPLSWLVERFWPVPGWTDDDLARAREAGVAFTNLHPEFLGVLGVVPPVPLPMADHATPMPVDCGGQGMPILAMSLPELSGGSTVPLENVIPVREEHQMGGIATKPVSAYMIENWDLCAFSIRDRADEPSIDKPMDSIPDLIDSHTTITGTGSRTSPNPALPDGVNQINLDLGKKASDILRREILDDKHIIHTQIVPLSKGIVYYTDNRLDPQIMAACQKQLLKCTNGYPIVSVSLQPMDFGANIHMNLERSYLTMFKQILAGLEACDADIVFLCEHDILYHPSHFDFVPARKDVFYYNNNSWKVDSRTGQALFYYCNQTFALCAYRDLLLEHYRKRVERVEREGSFDRHIGFEPGTHSFPRGIDNYGWEVWMSEQPSIDIRHGLNLTKSRWSQDEFRNKKFCQGWTMADEVPGWGVTKGRFDQILKEIDNG